jgi:hypothetical protein
MIAFLLLTPMLFLSTLTSMFAGVMGMMSAVFSLVMGMLTGAMMVCSTAFLGIMIFILS